MSKPADRRMAHVAFDAGWDAHAAYVQPEIREALRAAYETGWSHACGDWLQQVKNPDYPIGRGKEADYASTVEEIA